jgi:ribosomal protein S18 acetylase RimI-like enzyme
VARADDETVLGVCECEVLERKLWHMSGLCVLPTARRRGVGHALVATVQRDALAERRPLFLHVEAANIPARELYTRCGFELVDQLLRDDERELLSRRAARSVDPTAPLEVLFGIRGGTPPSEEQRGKWRPVVKARAGRRE